MDAGVRHINVRIYVTYYIETIKSIQAKYSILIARIMIIKGCRHVYKSMAHNRRNPVGNVCGRGPLPVWLKYREGYV